METFVSGWLPLVVLWFGGLNLLTFACAFYDKLAAVRRWPRVPDWVLLRLSFLGGGFAAKLAQMVFGWKVLDRSFSNTVTMICILQAAILANVVVVQYVDRDAVVAALFSGEEDAAEDTPPQPVRFGPGA